MNCLCNIFDESNLWILILILAVLYLLCNAGSSCGCGCGGGCGGGCGCPN